jgi:hypothetical protein
MTTTSKPIVKVFAEPLLCEILDSFGDVESAATLLTAAEAFAWYLEHGVSPEQLAVDASGFTFTRSSRRHD